MLVLYNSYSFTLLLRHTKKLTQVKTLLIHNLKYGFEASTMAHSHKRLVDLSFRVHLQVTHASFYMLIRQGKEVCKYLSSNKEYYYTVIMGILGKGLRPQLASSYCHSHCPTCPPHSPNCLLKPLFNHSLVLYIHSCCIAGCCIF